MLHPVFTIVTTCILTFYWFQIWFPFCHFFLPKLYVIIFCWFFEPLSVSFFFFHSLSVVTANCDNRRKMQINEFEWHSLALPFNSDFYGGLILLFSSGWKRWNQFYHYYISGCGEILKYNRLRQMELISFQWDLKSETCRDFRLRVPLWGSCVFIWHDVFNQGCCIFIQYNLLKGCCEWILIQLWTQVIDYSLPGLT